MVPLRFKVSANEPIVDGERYQRRQGNDALDDVIAADVLNCTVVVDTGTVQAECLRGRQRQIGGGTGASDTTRTVDGCRSRHAERAIEDVVP